MHHHVKQLSSLDDITEAAQVSTNKSQRLKSSPALNLFSFNVVSLRNTSRNKCKMGSNALQGQTEGSTGIKEPFLLPLLVWSHSKQLTAVCLMIKALKVCTCATVWY